jgi:hypothetical protein
VLLDPTKNKIRKKNLFRKVAVLEFITEKVAESEIATEKVADIETATF